MALSTKGLVPHGKSALLLSIITLATWRLRQSWLLLAITGLGMVASVMLACSVPLFSQVSTTVGLREVLNASPESPYIYLEKDYYKITPSIVHSIGQQLTSPVQKSLGQYISGPPEPLLQTQQMDLASPNLLGNGAYNSMMLFGTNISHAMSHVTLIKGRLPHDSGLEIAITPSTAAALKLGVGSDITVQFKIMVYALNSSGLPAAVNKSASSIISQLKLHVVGLFKPALGQDVFWHGNNFEKISVGDFFLFRGLVSEDALAQAFAHSLSRPDAFFQDPSTLYWIYRLDPLRISSTQLNDLLQKISILQVHIPNQRIYIPGRYLIGEPPSIFGVPVGLNGHPSDLQRYHDRIAALQIPSMLLTLQVLLLVLFFLMMTAELLVSRQADAIALLRSRGASRRQIIYALLTQSIGLAVIALLVGPLIALLAVRIVMQHILLLQDQNALNTLTWSTIFDLRWYALGAAFVTVVTMLIAIYRATALDVLALRRTASRTTAVPFWQRLNLDMVAALIALLGYVVSQYIISTQALDARTGVLLSTPLALIAPIFLCVAALLLFLRFFPFILRQFSRLAISGRGAPPMLALAHMARAPLQFVRMTFLLAFTVAFVIFALVFTASQTQHTYDIAAYQTGADFSGPFLAQPSTTPSMAQVIDAYHHLSGVASVSAGHMEEVATANGVQSLNVELNAVDARTFAQTVDWQQWNAQLSLPSLLGQLATRPNTDQGIPALVDPVLWNALHLSVGAPFSLQTSGDSRTVSFVAVKEMLHIPQNSGDTSSTAIVVNYDNYVNYYKTHFSSNASWPVINYVWVRVNQSPGSIKQVRSALNSGPLRLMPLYDRASTIQTLQNDAMYLNLIGILTIGAVTALLLSLFGNWLASWISVQVRQTNFALLRALGTTPGQVASVLAWEQGIVYMMALVMGVLFGLFLTFTMVPTLVFTSVPTSGQGSLLSSDKFYALQSVIPTQIVFSSSLVIALLVLVVICVVVLSMMVRVVSKPSLSQMLRLNED